MATRKVRTSSKYAIILAPVLLMVLCATFLLNPATRRMTLWMLEENHPVELLTFVAALAGGVLGLSLAWRARKNGEKPFVVWCYAALGAGLIFVGMEEVAWGQQFLGFASPEVWRSINVQGETTLHNVVGLQGRSEIFRLMFGLGFLIAVRLSFSPAFQKIGSPVILLPWFAVIALHAGVDVYNDYFPVGIQFDFYMQRTSELVEMLIGVSGLLYVLLNSQVVLPAFKHRQAVS